ncbi:unnamed protein product [Choristocarpus tenellus]
MDKKTPCTLSPHTDNDSGAVSMTWDVFSTSKRFKKGCNSMDFFQRLYGTLEAVVREENRDWDGRQPRNPSQYTRPMLWYSGMTGEDLDRYHAETQAPRLDQQRSLASMDCEMPTNTGSSPRDGGKNHTPVSNCALHNRSEEHNNRSTAVVNVNVGTGVSIEDARTNTYPGSGVTATEDVKLHPIKPSAKDIIDIQTAVESPKAHSKRSVQPSSPRLHPELGAQQCSIPGAVSPTKLPPPSKLDLYSHDPVTSSPRKNIFPLQPTLSGTPARYADLRSWGSCTSPTQTGMLPGLPSQLLISQGEHVQAKEGETPQSEYDSPMPPLVNSPIPTSSSTVNSPSWPSNLEQQNGIPRSSRMASQDSPDVEGEENNISIYRRFVQALHERTPPMGNMPESQDQGGGELGIGSGARPTSMDASLHHLHFIPTNEALPPGIVGGQAWVITALERMLLEARNLSPEGYTTRALELARLVLQEPTVCVRSIGRTSSVEGTAESGWKTVEGEVSGVMEKVVGIHNRLQVVGVAGCIWDMLEAEVS